MIVPTTLRTKILLSSMFVYFHSSLIFTALVFLGFTFGITNQKEGGIIDAIVFLGIAIGIPFGLIGWRYIIVRLTGKGDWIWNQKDLDRYNKQPNSRGVKE